jgi:peptidoglycan lytic transglycosylase G
VGGCVIREMESTGRARSGWPGGGFHKALLGAVVLVAGLAVAVIGLYQRETGGSRNGAPVKVLVKPLSTGQQIARTLRQDGVVGSDLALRVFLKLRGGGQALKAGEYDLRRDMPFGELVATLERGPKIAFVKLTLPEGFTVAQTAQRIGEVTKVPADAFLQAATPATVKPAILPDGVSSLEGFLYPETYYVIEKEGAPDLVRRLVGEFGKRTAGLPWDRAQALGRSPYEILVIASMIEREAQDPKEAPLVSAVIYNRLRANMALGIDATIRYGIEKPTGALLQSELDRDTPYNTRLHAGIPPTPIANPGATAIKAALEPAGSDALYFVRVADCRHHFFTKSFQEFQARAAEQPASC